MGWNFRDDFGGFCPLPPAGGLVQLRLCEANKYAKFAFEWRLSVVASRLSAHRQL